MKERGVERDHAGDRQQDRLRRPIVKPPADRVGRQHRQRCDRGPAMVPDDAPRRAAGRQAERRHERETQHQMAFDPGAEYPFGPPQQPLIERRIARLVAGRQRLHEFARARVIERQRASEADPDQRIENAVDDPGGEHTVRRQQMRIPGPAVRARGKVDEVASPSSRNFRSEVRRNPCRKCSTRTSEPPRKLVAFDRAGTCLTPTNATGGCSTFHAAIGFR